MVASAHANLLPAKDIALSLGVTEPILLPDSPFYFIKNWGRGIQMFFVLDPAKKAELELKFTDEKLVEVVKVLEHNAPKDSMDKALQNYLDAHTRLAARFESLRGKNKNVDTLLIKLGEKVTKHKELFENLKDDLEENKAAEAEVKIDESKQKGEKLGEEKDMRLESKKPTPKENQKDEQKEEKPVQSRSKDAPPQIVSVNIENFAFKEKEIKIPPGSTVTWTNKDGVGHDVTSDAGKFQSELLAQGKSYSRTFNDKGIFPYHCTPHPRMKGKIIVE